MQITTELDSFSGKELRTAQRVALLMSNYRLTFEDLAAHIKNNMSTGIHQTDNSKTDKENHDIELLGADETEIMPDMKCDCGGSFYIVGLCGQQVIEHKCIRLALCNKCPKEIKIR